MKILIKEDETTLYMSDCISIQSTPPETPIVEFILADGKEYRLFCDDVLVATLSNTSTFWGLLTVFANHFTYCFIKRDEL